jgi:hypothetical protein
MFERIKDYWSNLEVEQIIAITWLSIVASAVLYYAGMTAVIFTAILVGLTFTFWSLWTLFIRN